MAEKSVKPEVRAALFELQRYLSDEVAPLMALDSIETVIKQPPELVANQINAWIGSQVRGPGAGIPVSDFLFHAIKKIHHFAELQLIPGKSVDKFIAALKEPILDLCPPEDRELLRKNLDLVSESTDTSGMDAEIVYRQPGTEKKLASDSSSGDRVEVEKRISLILDRLSRMPIPRGGGSLPAARGVVISEAVSAAAGSARSREELDENLDQIRSAGVDVDPAQLFRYLGNSLPEWAVPITESVEIDGEEFPSSEGQPLDAMKRLISYSDDPDETARRFRQFVEAAIEQFNQGSIGRAVTMFELAENLLESGTVSGEVADGIRHAAAEKLDAARLRTVAGTTESHYLLRKLLNFFPDYRTVGLLENLQKEQRRDRRRLLLALVEVHGRQAREAALEKLEALGGQKLASNDPYFARNLLYILNRIPATEETVEKEIELAGALSSTRHRPFIAKEAFAVLGQPGSESAAQVLTQRLGELEAMVTKGGKPPYPTSEIHQLMSRAVSALVRVGTPAALVAVVDHGLSRNEGFGDTIGRLSALGSLNLSEEPEIVKVLLDALNSELPTRVLGITVKHKNDENVDKLLDALAGTDSPEVLAVLEQIRQKHPDLPFAEKASTILASAGVKGTAATVATTPMISGDTNLFGLPNLLQNISSNEFSGVLTLSDRQGNTIGALAFIEGRIVRSHTGDLRGKDAVFQLFEGDTTGSFTFVERRDIAKEESEEALDVMPLVLEALRRYDELRSARALVPPDTGLAPTDVKPAHDAREKDPKVIREVWLKAASGEPPASWEEQIRVDSYRIWRLIAHWIKTGALIPKDEPDPVSQ